MSFVPTEQLQKAKQMDLLTYLQLNDPGELIRLSGNNYCTREHDSLKISNGKWYWFSRGIGGITALDYLIKVKEFTLPQAVEMILGTSGVTEHKPAVASKLPRKILLPERNGNNAQVIQYLRSRGIHPGIIQYCIDQKILYESKDYHNAVFVGMDQKGQTRYAAIRGTRGAYKGEATGSDKHYSFHVAVNPEAEDLHVFESAIDLMSYLSLKQMKGQSWKEDAYLSLAGVFQMRRERVVPAALQEYLEQHGEITTVHLHLDNDEVRKGATEGIIASLSNQYCVLDEPPGYGKDFNEQLMMVVGLIQNKKEVLTR